MPHESDPAGAPLAPRPLEIAMSVSQCVDQAFLAPPAAALRRAAQALSTEVLSRPGALLGVSLDAPLLAAGAGVTALGPLVRAGLIDWIAASGANLFCDALLALGRRFHAQPPEPGAPDWVRCGEELWIARGDLQAADQALREIFALPDFQRTMGTAQMHALLGAHLRAREKSLGCEHPSLLSTAHEFGVPIYNPAPADNPLGALIAEMALVGNRLVIDSSIDLNEAAAILNAALKAEPVIALWSLGGGAAAAFMRSLPRHLDTALACPPGCAYRLICCLTSTGAAPCGGDPRAIAPAEEIRVPADLALTLPLLAAYLLDRVPPRAPKRLAAHAEEWLDRLRQDRLQATLRRPLEFFP